MDIDKLRRLGIELGYMYEGDDLKGFVRDQQTILREERVAEREKEKEEMELEREKGDRELEREKWEGELERDKAHEMVKLKEIEFAHELNILTLKARSAMPSHMQESPSSNFTPRAPKLPPFTESTDEMDSYLLRFERYATSMKWDKSVWAILLSALLQGNALSVYSLLPADKAVDYDVLKTALLKRFDMTEDGFKSKFRVSKPESGETFQQFSVRLGSYLTRWIEMAEVEQTYEGLYDLILRYQLVKVCNRELRLFIKYLSLTSPTYIESMASLADQFKEARGMKAAQLVRQSGNYPNRSHSPGNDRNLQKRDTSPGHTSRKVEYTGYTKSDKRCYRCGRHGHIATDCPDKHKVGSVTRDDTRGRQGEHRHRRPNWGKRSTSRSSSRSPSPRGRNVRFDDDNENVKVCNTCTIFGTEGLDVMSNNCVPMVTTSYGKPQTSSMPTSSGRLCNLSVSVLRDTGCSGVVVKHALIDSKSLIGGTTQVCVLADGNKVEVPMADLYIDTPYCVGDVEAWCMENPIYDVIIGNISGAREPNDPDPTWVVAAVQTRQQVRNQEKPHPKLKVPGAIDDEVSVDDMRKDQEQDETLAKIRESVKEGKVITGKNESKVRFIEKKGLVYRLFESKRVAHGKLFSQLVVPKKHRRAVVKLAHESLMAGHMSTGRTVCRVLSEFYWPGVQSDTRRFCRSCDICQRTMKASERNYAVIEKEYLAIVWTIQKFSRYLYGTEFLLETDHQPLTYLNKARVANARPMRWALQLQPYRFRIVAIKGSENVGADYLSRQ